MPPQVRQPETRLVAEYMASHFPVGAYATNVALGPPLPGTVEELGLEKALRTSRPYRMKVDGLAWPDNELVLVEGKVWRPFDGLAKLPIYRDLVPQSPDLRAYQGRRLVLQLVTPWSTEPILELARSYGVQVVIYRPEWIDRAVEDHMAYWTREHRERREEKRRLRETFGLE